MNPQAEKNPGLQLPQPFLEFGANSVAPPTEGRPSSSPEVGTYELGLSPTPPVPAVPAIPVPTAAPPAGGTTSSVTTSTKTAVSDEDENDLDEEWTKKAKAIVEMTRDDPYLQSNELGKVKAEFLKVRYNKEIKVARN